LAKAADPDVCSLAVWCGKDGKWFVWGMIDQELHYLAYLNHESEEGAERPGQFTATITGIGSLSVSLGNRLVADLRQDRLIREYPGGLHAGPVAATLRTYVEDYIRRAKESVPKGEFELRDHWPASLTRTWMSALARILKAVQRYKHGGAILVTPTSNL